MHYAELKQAREELIGPGGAFEIVQADVLGRHVRIYRNAPGSMREMWLSTAVLGARDYLVYQGERLSYCEAHRQVDAVAA